jgi:hypothetical protein
VGPLTGAEKRHLARAGVVVMHGEPGLKPPDSEQVHATVGFTLDRYSHVLPGLQEEAAERTGALIYGAG